MSIKNGQIKNANFLHVLTYKFMQYPLYELLEFLGEKKFTEYMLKFANTFHKVPSWTELKNNMIDYQLGLLYNEIVTSLNKKDKIGWSNAELQMQKFAKMSKLSYTKAFERGQKFWEKELPVITKWINGMKKWESKNYTDINSSEYSKFWLDNYGALAKVFLNTKSK